MLYAAVKSLILFSKLLPINTRNYVNHIRQRFGPLNAKHVFWYAKLQIKQAKLKKDIEFLKTCIKEQLTPTFVRIKIPTTHQHYKYAIHRFRMQLLHDEMKIQKRKLTENYKISKNLLSLLKTEITGLTLMKLKSIFKELVQEKLGHWKTTHERKLNTLRGQKVPIPTKATISSTSSKIITNLSSRQLTDVELSTLEQGFDYVFPPTKFDDRMFIANIETFFVNLLGYATEKHDYEEKSETELTIYNLTPAQLECANKLRSTCNTFRRTVLKNIKNQQKQMKKTKQILRTLSKDDSIVITRPDKGRGIVILNKNDYIKKINDILSDTTTFEEITEDPTIKNENKLNSYLLKLKNDGFITADEYNYTKSRGSQPATIYGLPKIHKKPDADGLIPIRPIVSSSNTFNYRLSKLLANKLNHLRQNSNITKDSFSFVKWLHELEFDPNEYKMLSFDITSLFTKVPLDQTIEIILEKLYGKKHTCIFSKEPRITWCRNCEQRYKMNFLLKMATKETHFIFNDKIYYQRNGIAMGSPLSPIFADVYVNYLENKFMKRINKNGVIHYKRFVDDTFTLVHKDTDKNKILEILNSYDNEIQFTCEEEKKRKLSFLDVKIRRTKTSSTPLVTSIHRKKTFTGLLLKWSSYVPKTYKISTISSMIYRAIKICSTFKLMTHEFDNIRKLATQNGYPKNFIESQIRQTLNRYYNRKESKNSKCSTAAILGAKKKEQIYIDIPYFDKTTEQLGKKLIKIATSVGPQLHVQPIPRPPPATATFFSSKDKIPISLQSGVVYELSCQNCQVTYIGKTLRQVQRRLQEHGKSSPPEPESKIPIRTTTASQKDVRRSKRTLKPIDRYGISQVTYNSEEENENNTIELKTFQSAVFKHANQHQHNINWNEIKIIDKDSIPYRLLIRESLAIKQSQPTLNRTVNSAPLLVIPEGLLTKKPTVKIKQHSDNVQSPTKGI